jgi:hypothetical protein
MDLVQKQHSARVLARCSLSLLTPPSLLLSILFFRPFLAHSLTHSPTHPLTHSLLCIYVGTLL